MAGSFPAREEAECAESWDGRHPGHKLTPHEIHAALRRVTIESPQHPAHPTTTPVLCGAALKNKGVHLLLGVSASLRTREAPHIGRTP